MSFLLKIIIFFSPIQSFVFASIIKGLTIFNVGVIIRFFIGLFYIKKGKSLLLYYLLSFLIIYFTIFILQQFMMYLFPVVFYKDAIFVSGDLGTSMFLRSSFFTQSIYLFICILFFDYIINYLQKNSLRTFINFIFFSVIAFVVYGYFEFFYIYLQAVILILFQIELQVRILIMGCSKPHLSQVRILCG